MAAILDGKQQKNVRTALRALRLRMKAWSAVARALHYDYDSIEKIVNGRRNVTPRLVFRLADLLDTGIDDLLGGRYVPPGTCPHCGRSPDFTDEGTVLDA